MSYPWPSRRPPAPDRRRLAPQSTRAPGKLCFEALESRLLLSADIVGIPPPDPSLLGDEDLALSELMGRNSPDPVKISLPPPAELENEQAPGAQIEWTVIADSLSDDFVEPDDLFSSSENPKAGQGDYRVDDERSKEEDTNDDQEYSSNNPKEGESDYQPELSSPDKELHVVSDVLADGFTNSLEEAGLSAQSDTDGVPESWVFSTDPQQTEDAWLADLFGRAEIRGEISNEYLASLMGIDMASLFPGQGIAATSGVAAGPTQFSTTIIADPAGGPLLGTADDEILIGGIGNDQMAGAGGGDRYVFANTWGTDEVNELVGEGIDTLDFSEVTTDLTFTISGTTGSVTVSDGLNTIVANNIENLIGGSGDDIFVFQNEGDSLPGFIDGGAGTNTLDYASYTSGVSADLIARRATGALFINNIQSVIGGSADDELSGDEQVNALQGGAGNDTLSGGGGSDILDGGGGNDTVSYALASAGVTVDLDTGVAPDSLSSFENIIGSRFRDILTGDAGVNVISGGDGDDLIDGGGDVDTLLGEGGVDTVSYASATSGVTVDLGAGMAPDAISGFENIVGSGFADTLTGDGGNNVIEGGAGNDMLTGGTGVDTVSFEAATAGVVVDLTLGAQQATGGAGTDALGGFDSVIGSAVGGDMITGNINDNIITVTATAGNDSDVTGGAGTDLLRVDARGGGFDDTMAGQITLVNGVVPDGVVTHAGVETVFVDNTAIGAQLAELEMGLASLAQFALSLEGFDENDEVLPLIGENFGTVAAFGTVLERLHQDFEAQMAGFVSADDVVEFLRDWSATLIGDDTGLDDLLVSIDPASLSGGVEAGSGDQLSFTLSLNAARTSSVSLGQSSTLTDAGVFIDGELGLDSAFDLDFTFGIDGFDAFFVQVDGLTVTADVDNGPAPLTADARVGFLNVDLDDGTVLLDADVAVVINGGARMSTADLDAAAVLDDLNGAAVINVTNATVDADFVVSVDAGFDPAGDTPPGTTITLDSANFLAAPANPAGLDDLDDFTLATPNEVLASLDQLGGWFAALAESALLDLQIPFTDDTSIGEVLDFARAFGDDILRHFVNYDGLLLAPGVTALTEETSFSLVVETAAGETTYRVKLSPVMMTGPVVDGIADAVRLAVGDNTIADQIEIFQENDGTGSTRIGFRAVAGAADVTGVHVPLIDNETVSALGDRLFVPASILENGGLLGHPLQFELKVDSVVQVVTVNPSAANASLADLIADIQTAVDETFGLGVLVDGAGAAQNEISFTVDDAVGSVGTVRLLGVLDATALVPGELSLGPESASFPTAQDLADELSLLLSNLTSSAVDIDVLFDDQEISFDVDWNHVFDNLASVPINFGLDLGDFANVESISTLDISANIDFDFTFGVTLTPTDAIAIAPPVFLPDLPVDGVLGGPATFGFDIFQDNFVEEIRLGHVLGIDAVAAPLIPAAGGGSTVFDWTPPAVGTVENDLSFVIEIADAGADSQFVFGTLLAFDTKTNDDQAALAEDIQAALNRALTDAGEVDLSLTVVVNGSQLEISAASQIPGDTRTLQILEQDEFLVASIDSIVLAPDADNESVDDLVADLQDAVDAALMAAGIEPIKDIRLGISDVPLIITASGDALDIEFGDGEVPDNGVLQSDLRFMIDVNGTEVFGIVKAVDTLENETTDDPTAALAEDVQNALQAALDGFDVEITVQPRPALGFGSVTLGEGNSVTAATPPIANMGVLEEDLAFQVNSGSGDIFAALRAEDTRDNESLEDLANDLEDAINRAFDDAGDAARVSVTLDAEDRLVITAEVGNPTIDFTQNIDTRLQFYATSDSAAGTNLDIMFFSPAVVAVDAANRVSLYAAAVAEEGSSDSAPKILERSLQIHVEADNPALTELGLNSSPIPFDGQLSGEATFTLVVDGTRLDVMVDGSEVDPGVANASVDDLIADIQQAVDDAIALSDDPTLEVEVRRVMLGNGSSSANRIEFAAVARTIEILNRADGTLNDIAINELGFDAENSSEVRAQSGEFFLRDTSVTGNLILAANDIQAVAQFGFSGPDGDEPGLGLGVSATGVGAVTASAGLSLINPDDGTSRVSLERIWEILGTGELEQIRTLVDADISGLVDIDLSIEPTVGLGTQLQAATVDLDLNIADWLDQAPQVSDVRDDQGNPVGELVNVNVSGLDVAVYEAFSNLSFTDIIVALNDVVDYLRDVQGIGDSEAFAAILDTKLPLLNQSVSELLDVGERFALFAEGAEENPSGTVQLLEEVIEDLLGLSDPSGDSGAVEFSIDAADGIVLRLDLDFATGLEDSLGLDLDLDDYISRVTDGVPFLDGVKSLVGVSTTGDLDVSLDADLRLSLGLVLDDEDGVEAFLYTGDDGTRLSLDATAVGSGLDFTAQLGPFGFFVNDGMAQLTGTFVVSTDDDGDGRFFFAEDEISVTATLSGSATADLPLFFPDESTPIGDDPNSNSLVLTIGSLVDFLDRADDSVVIDTPDLTAFPTPTLIGMLSNPEFLLDGLDTLLLTIQDALNGQIYGIDLPFIGDQLAPAGQFVGDFREDLLGYLSLKLREGGLNPIDLVQETLYNVFGGQDDGDPRAVEILGFDMDQFGFDDAGVLVAANDFDINDFDQQARFLLNIDGATPALVTIDREDIVDGDGDDLDDLIQAVQISLLARGLDQKVEAGREGNRLKFTVLGEGGHEISIDKAHAVAIQIGGLKVGALDILKDFETGLAPEDPDNPDVVIDINDVSLSGFGLVDTFGQFDLKLGQNFAYNQPIDFDFALPVLGFDLDAGIQLDFGWELDFGFGVDQTQGFYFATQENLPHADGDPDATQRTDELSITLLATLDGGESGGADAMLQGELGFLALQAQDQGSQLEVAFTVDLADPNDDGFLTFSELVSSSTSFEDVLTASLAVDAQVLMDVVVNFDALGIDATLLPEIEFELEMAWMAAVSTSDTGGPDIGAPDVNFNDIQLDLGSFISDFAGPFLEDIGAVLEPLDWLLDRDSGLLYQRLPVISDLAGESVTLKSLAELLDTENKITPFLNAVEEIFFLVNLVGDAAAEAQMNGESIMLEFGSISISGLDLAGSSSLSETNFTETVAPGMGIDEASGMAGASTQAFTKNVTKPNGMLSFDILESGNIIKLLLGDPAVDLVSYRLPEFGFNFEYLQRFPVFPPLFATLRGFFSSTIELGFGYDTFGLSLFQASDNPLDLIGGFFVDDLNSEGLDIPEVTLIGGIAAGASLDAGVASAGVEGGIDATILFNLNDPDLDGKVRLNEMAGNILINSFNPIAIFDTSGRIDAFLRAYVEVLFGLWSKEMELARVTLAQFDIPFERLPLVAQDMGGGEIVINMGPSAESRLHGDVSDGDEQIFARFDAGSVFIWGNGRDEAFAQRFIGVDRIVVSGGAGNDIIDFSAMDNSGITVEINGGTGDDMIIGGAGTNIIFGGEGDDTITGGSGNDELMGGMGDDTISGMGGRDLIFGGDGVDVLLGGGGDDDLSGGSGDDSLDGGTGDDTYLFASDWGSDTVLDSGGSDTWDFSDTRTDIDFTLGVEGLGTDLTSAASLSNSVSHDGFEIEAILGGRGGDVFTVFQTGSERVLLNGQSGSDRYIVLTPEPEMVPEEEDEEEMEPLIQLALQDIGNSWDRDSWLYFGSDGSDAIDIRAEGIGADRVDVELRTDDDQDGLAVLGFDSVLAPAAVLTADRALADGDLARLARFEISVGDDAPVLVAVDPDSVGLAKTLDDLVDALNQALMDNGLGALVGASLNEQDQIVFTSLNNSPLQIVALSIGPGIESLELDALAGDDSINVISTRDDMSVIVRGDVGNDLIVVGADIVTDRDGNVVLDEDGNPISGVDAIDGGALTGPLIIDGGEGADRLDINDRTDVSDNVGSLTDRFVSGLDMPVRVEYGGIEDIRVFLGLGADDFTIVSTIQFETLVHGGAGDDNVNVKAIEGQTTVIGGEASDVFNVGTSARPTTIEIDLDAVDTVQELVDALNAAFASAGLSVHAGRLGELLTLETVGASEPATLEIIALDGNGEAIELLGFTPGAGVTGSEADFEARLTAALMPQLEDEGFAGLVSFQLKVDLAPGQIGGGVIDDINANLIIHGDEDPAVSGIGDPQGVDILNVDDDGATLDNLGLLTGDTLNLDDLRDRDGNQVSIRYAELETLNILLGSGNDVFNVLGTSAAEDRVLGEMVGEFLVEGTIVESGSGDVTFNVSSDAPTNQGDLEDIRGPLTVRAEDGVNTLNVSDLADDTGDTVVITNRSIVGLSPAPIFYETTGFYGGGIHIFSGTDDDNVFVESTLGGSLTLLHTHDGDDVVTTNALNPNSDGMLAVFGELGRDMIDAQAAQLGVILFGDVGQIVFTQDQLGRSLLQRVGNITVSVGSNDLVIGGAGNDFLFGGAASDTVTGNSGDDTIFGDYGQVTFVAGVIDNARTGNLLNGDNDILRGGGGDDTLFGGELNDVLGGEDGDDVMIGDHGQIAYVNGQRQQISTTLPGSGGADQLTGGAGADVLLGGARTDRLLGEDGSDILIGDDGEVTYAGTNLESVRSTFPNHGGDDQLFGGLGDDVLIGGGASDLLAGDDGDDHVLGDGGLVTYRNGSLFQVQSHDHFIGGPDDLGGGEGNDTLIGGAGFDLLRGSLAEDILIFEYGRVTFNERGLVDFVVTLGQRPLDLAASTMFDLYLKPALVVPPYFVDNPASLEAVRQDVEVRVSTGELQQFHHDDGALPDGLPPYLAPPDDGTEAPESTEGVPGDGTAPGPVPMPLNADDPCHVRPWECEVPTPADDTVQQDTAWRGDAGTMTAGVAALGLIGWREKNSRPTQPRRAGDEQSLIRWHG